MAISRSLGGSVVMSRSPMKILPSFTSSSPASMRRVVDLPQPEGPTRTMNSPSRISRSMPGTAGVSEPGYQRCAFSNLTEAMEALPPPAGTCRTIRCEAGACHHRPPGPPFIGTGAAFLNRFSKRTHRAGGWPPVGVYESQPGAIGEPFELERVDQAADESAALVVV